ncbi:hypothetical protein RIEGSTA812A_PEG_105 [invertebrate metagenome]|uniref:Uncharacterized protein n=1 Tax=invertebrate metagenome TaxID=1711999 RepID=A0A484HA16_9ZZZZ
MFRSSLGQELETFLQGAVNSEIEENAMDTSMLAIDLIHQYTL